MSHPSLRQRFDAYRAELHEALGNTRRHRHFDAYCSGLMLNLERKSVEPMAAALEPDNVRSAHQGLHHFVADAPWSDRALLERIESLSEAAMGEAPRYWLVDDSGMLKKGTHSVGVARQYCGQLGKQENCQVAVSLSLATQAASVPIAYRLYLPEPWASDAERREGVGVPQELRFATKPQIALEQIRAACARGTSPGTVVADAAYGSDLALREGLDELGPRLLARHRARHARPGAGSGAAAAHALLGPWTTTEEHGHRTGAQTGVGRGTRA